MTKVKFCKIQTLDEFKIAQELGVDYVGLHQISSDSCDEEKLSTFATIRDFPPEIVLLTKSCGREWLDHIVIYHRYKYLQIHVHINEIDFSIMGRYVNQFGVRLILVIDPSLRYTPNEIRLLRKWAWAVLFDNQIGGLGQRIDLVRVPHMLGSIPPRFFVAGGLDATNVADVMSATQPWGVDVQSSIRKDGKWDFELSQLFINAVREGMKLSRDGMQP